MNQALILKKTRFAPTPSGYLHLGNIYSFAITAALAKKTGAKILLRIDDFDMERTHKIYVQDIFDTLNFLGIPWDEGPRNLHEYEHEYSLRHRLGNYNKALQHLRDNNQLFACTCTRTQVHKDPAHYGYLGTCRNKQLSLDTANTSWRLFTTDSTDLFVRTFEGTKVMATLPEDMKDFIVRKKDGFPAYQLISVLDDLHYGIDLVVRGDDLWQSTLAQEYLSLQLNQRKYQDITFHHHPLLMDVNGHKLAKSEGAASVHHLRLAHKTPTDIYSAIGKILGIKEPVGSWEELTDRMALPA